MIGSALASGSRSPAFSARLCRRSLRVGGGVLIGDLALREALKADAEARGVHHDEHAGEALLRLADQPALRAVIVHDAGRVAWMPIFFSRAPHDAVALAERAVLVHEELRHHEQRDAFHIVRRAGDLGEDQVDDVLRQVVLARRDENFGAGDRIAAVGVGLGAGLQKPRSVPQCGSVRFIVPVQLPVTMFGTYFCFSSSLPLTSSEAIAPEVSPWYISKLWLADRIYSVTAVPTTCGRPCPPYSSGAGQRRPAGLDELV